jgi:hypothetical protein
VVGERPLGGLAMKFLQQGAVVRQVPDQHREPAGGEPAVVPVQEVDAVVAEQVRLQGLGVLFDELAEAQSSPRPSPVSLP